MITKYEALNCVIFNLISLYIIPSIPLLFHIYWIHKFFLILYLLIQLFILYLPHTKDSKQKKRLFVKYDISHERDNQYSSTKIAVFWNSALRTLAETDRHFRGTELLITDDANRNCEWDIDHFLTDYTA
jgi:hypothetical protein